MPRPVASGDPPGQGPVFLSTGLADRREVRVAQVAVLISSVIFVAAAPFARMPLAPVVAFVPAYVSALVICDLITAALLVGQFNFVRSPRLIVLACAYLFTATMTMSYLLMFPGLFSPAGLLGAGPQSTSAMYMVWHGGFALAVIAYALLKDDAEEATEDRDPPRRASHTVVLSSAAVVAIVVAVTVLSTAGHQYLPVFIEGNSTTLLGHLALTGIWLLSFAALILLWRRQPHTVIDLWMIVVMWVWLFDMGLAALLNGGRYDLGWYVGRIYGLLAASVLLVVLLLENSSHYAALVRTSAALSAANRLLERLSLLDGLTNLSNRRFFDSYLAAQIAVANRQKRPLALVIYDVDSFKAYNDRYGHLAGDTCLRQVADALGSCCRRPADMVARYGGEEFAMILPDTDLLGAAHIAEAARDAVAALRVPHDQSPAAPHVSISGGISVLTHTRNITAQQLIEEADTLLFKAKSLGRNRIVSVQPSAEKRLA